MDAVRSTIVARGAELGLSLSELSLKVGKNDAYFQQFIKRGVPNRLPGEVRGRGAETLGLDGLALRQLGANLRSMCCRRHDGTALLRWRERFRKSASADQPRVFCGCSDFERRRARAACLREAVPIAGRQASEAGTIQPEKDLGVPGVNRRCNPPYSYEQRE